MKTALLVIATGEKYHKFVQPLLASARTYFVPHTAVVFSDADDLGCGERPYMKIHHEEWPGPTLHRYHTFLMAEKYLSSFDYLYYLDVDMRFVAPVGEEIFSDGITATEHPGYTGMVGDPERRPESAAYISPYFKNTYFCGGFIGGASEKFLYMADILKHRISQDTKDGIVAKWHDESHLNHFLWCHPPAKILTPSYCWPDVPGDYYKNIWKNAGRPVYEPKILALTKGPR